MSTRLLNTKPFPKEWTISISNSVHDKLVEAIEPFIVAGRIPWNGDAQKKNGDNRIVLPWERELLDQISAVVSKILADNIPDFQDKIDALKSGEIPILSFDNFPTRGNPKSLEYDIATMYDDIGGFDEIISIGMAGVLNRRTLIPTYARDPIATEYIVRNGKMDSISWHEDRQGGISILYGQKGNKQAETLFLPHKDLFDHPHLQQYRDIFTEPNFSFNGKRYKPFIIEEGNNVRLAKEIHTDFYDTFLQGYLEDGTIKPRNEEAIEAIETLIDVMTCLDHRLNCNTIHMNQKDKDQMQANTAEDRSIVPYSITMGPGTGIIFSQDYGIHSRTSYKVPSTNRGHERRMQFLTLDKAPPKQYNDYEIALLTLTLPYTIRLKRDQRDYGQTPHPDDIDLAEIYDTPSYRFRTSVMKRKHESRGR